ncbi:MAG TPA: hypothetical protein VHB77_15090 [Planctomycetaceae bacterium]|nr:hypothetical protein [Planctomycetaceae bacterium]
MNLRWILLTACLFTGCSPASPPETAGDQPERAAPHFDRLPAILAGISGPTTLYEGLPSAFWEPQQREAEATSKETVTLHGYRFYEEQPELSPADADALRALFADRQSYKPYHSQKNCSEFHADYCLEWQTAAGSTEAFVSLECAEVMLFTPQTDLHCDLTPDAAPKVKSLLGKYQENRPAPE